MAEAIRVESLLSARQLMSPQVVGEQIFFLSDLSGRLSLYSMRKGGSLPRALLPPHIALQNPILMDGELFYVFPELDKILVMIDQDGDENYQPAFIPLDGGLPVPIFGGRFQGQQVVCLRCDSDRNLAAFSVDPRTSPLYESYLVDLKTLEVLDLGSSQYGNYYAGASEDYSRIVLLDTYTVGDHVLYLWEKGTGERSLLYGRPLEQREEGEAVPLNSIADCFFTTGGKQLLFFTSLFEDSFGLAALSLDSPNEVSPVEIVGLVHMGEGELTHLRHLEGNRYLLTYNIDGCSWAYEGAFDGDKLLLEIDRIVCGQHPLSQGVAQSIRHEESSGSYAISFSTATSPSQIFTVESGSQQATQHSNERLLGLPQHLLSAGEDASYVSHDGLRVPARLYLPSEALGFEGKRPVIFYIHGGPQGQERPDFSWFSMPLIQFLTLNGFAVFVPNVRGSSGYGLEYMKRVDHDWGGADRLDHVEAFHYLRQDERLDLGRAGVTGRSYGGYMTLTLAGRHPELWTAACDMFGPYNLFTFLDRLPETWQTYFHLAIGHPEKDAEMLRERSPHTHLHQLACPLLVIQGANDPRVREAESRDLVDELRAQGKEIEYLVFQNEGHDVIKFENKVRCYNEIARFFTKHLAP